MTRLVVGKMKNSRDGMYTREEGKDEDGRGGRSSEGYSK